MNFVVPSPQDSEKLNSQSAPQDGEIQFPPQRARARLSLAEARALVRAEISRSGHPACTADLDVIDAARFLIWLQLDRFEQSWPVACASSPAQFARATQAAFAALAVQIVRACAAHELAPVAA